MISPTDILHGKILIVDDQEANVILLEEMLKGARYTNIASTMDPNLVCELHLINHYDLILLDLQMLGAVNATLGLELARERHPDVILMDINLPGMSGIQALKHLREDPLTAHIPVIAISANAMVGDIRKGLEAGFFHYLTKPINVNEFMKTVDQALEDANTELSPM